MATACCIIIGSEDEELFEDGFLGSDFAISTFNGLPKTSVLFNAKAAVASSEFEYSIYASCFESVIVQSTTVPQKLNSCLSCSLVSSGLRLLTWRNFFNASPFTSFSGEPKPKATRTHEYLGREEN